MIHTLLSLKRPLFVFDVESTGTDTQTDRIVELGFQQWTAEGMTKEWATLVNPGVPIQASASKVHGITDAKVNSCARCDRIDDAHTSDDCAGFKPWPTFKQLAPNLSKGLSNCDWAGQNIRFDLRILAAEFERAGVQWTYAGARIIDSYQLERLAVPRSLSHLHEKYVGMKHDGAHGALSDVRAAATVIMKQLQTHDALPRDITKLHELSWPGEIDTEGKFKFINGVACVAFGKWNGKPMSSVETSYWDWLCKSEFSAEVKALASAAKLGKYPVAE